MAEKQLIVNADDFGLSKSVNNGIIHGFRHGIITSTTLMVNERFAEHAVMLAKKHKLPVGIHLNIAGGKPVLGKKVSGLLKNNGCFHNPLFLGVKSLFLPSVRKQVELEFDAQIKRFLSFGLKPTHLDTHKYTSMYPWISKIVVKLAKKYRIKAVRCSFDCYLLPKFKISSISLFVRQLLVAMYVSFWSFFSKLALKNKIKTTDHYTGIMQVCAKSSDEAIASVIKNLKLGTTELMVHPGFIDDYLMKHSFYNKERAKELKALTSTNIKRLVKESKIMLISFEDL